MIKTLGDFTRTLDWRAATLVAALWLYMSPATAQTSLELAKSNACLTCHAMDRKLIGPAFRDVSQRYAKTPNAEALLARSIQSGGGGKWGPVPMPAQKQLTEAQARELAQWILSQK